MINLQEIPEFHSLVKLHVLPLVRVPLITLRYLEKNVVLRFITLPFLARDPKAIEVVQIILETVLLRREKNMLDSDGKPIVELPPKEVRRVESSSYLLLGADPLNRSSPIVSANICFFR